MQLKKIVEFLNYYCIEPAKIVTSAWRSKHRNRHRFRLSKAKVRHRVPTDPTEHREHRPGEVASQPNRLSAQSRRWLWFWHRKRQPKIYTSAEIMRKIRHRRHWSKVRQLSGPILILGLALMLGGSLLFDVNLPRMAYGAIFRYAGQLLVSVSTTMGMKIERVEFSGNHFIPTSELLAASGLVAGRPILTVDGLEVRRRLKSYSWIEEAVVETVPLQAIKITITERQPVALWRESTDSRSTEPFLLVDAAGNVITTEQEADYVLWRKFSQQATVPRIVGIGGGSLADSLKLLLASQPNLSNRVTLAEWVDQRRWNLVLDDRLLVKLPEGDLDKAWAVLAGVQFRYGILERQVAIIDLRQNDRIVMTPGYGSSAFGSGVRNEADLGTWNGAEVNWTTTGRGGEIEL